MGVCCGKNSYVEERDSEHKRADHDSSFRWLDTPSTSSASDDKQTAMYNTGGPEKSYTLIESPNLSRTSTSNIILEVKSSTEIIQAPNSASERIQENKENEKEIPPPYSEMIHKKEGKETETEIHPSSSTDILDVKPSTESNQEQNSSSRIIQEKIENENEILPSSATVVIKCKVDQISENLSWKSLNMSLLNEDETSRFGYARTMQSPSQGSSTTSFATLKGSCISHDSISMHSNFSGLDLLGEIDNILQRHRGDGSACSFFQEEEECPSSSASDTTLLSCSIGSRINMKAQVQLFLKSLGTQWSDFHDYVLDEERMRRESLLEKTLSESGSFFHMNEDIDDIIEKFHHENDDPDEERESLKSSDDGSIFNMHEFDERLSSFGFKPTVSRLKSVEKNGLVKSKSETSSSTGSYFNMHDEIDTRLEILRLEDAISELKLRQLSYNAIQQQSP